MALEEKIQFRNALLGQKSEEEWRSYRPCTQKDFNSDFYDSHFTFDGKEITGEELIEKYSQTFSSDREYSNRAELNRMFSECEIPQFTFSEPENLRGFLLSAKSNHYWKNNGLSTVEEFREMEVQYAGYRMKGRMLAYNVFVELENQQNGTFYSYGDYLQNPERNRELWKAGSKEFYTELFEMAGIELKRRNLISQADLSPKFLKEILLSAMTQEEWSKWKGPTSDFEKMQFELEGYEQFSGHSLRNAYNKLNGEKLHISDLFKWSNVPYNVEHLRKLHTKTKFQAKTNNLFENPSRLRKSLLEIMPQEEWSKPKQFQKVRLQRINFEGQELALHSLMHYFTMHKYNSQQESVEQKVDWEQQEQFSASSSRKVLDEILDLAGVQNRWIPTFEDVDLRDPRFIRRIFMNAEHEGEPISLNQFKQLSYQEQRRVRVKEPEIGFDKAVHSLSLYFTAYDFWEQNPEHTLNEIVQKKRKGKSNKSALNQILDFAGL